MTQSPHATPWDVVNDWIVRAAIVLALAAGTQRAQRQEENSKPAGQPSNDAQREAARASDAATPSAETPFIAIANGAAFNAPIAAAPVAPQNPTPHSLADTSDDGPLDGIGAASGSMPIGLTFQGNGFSATISGSGQFPPPPNWTGPRYRRYFTVTINPGTGYLETFIVQPPNVAATTPAPLLLAFHKYGVSQKDITKNTSFVWEAVKRGWYLVAPLSAAQIHYSSIESQTNTQAVLEWMNSTFAIDPTRIYGVGFSMGGGAAMNFAARHLDPAHPMFAAVVDHSGSVALKDVYLNDPSAHQPPYALDYWFGNGQPGSADPWKMERSSVLNFDDVTLQVEPDTDLCRNLLHMGVQIYRASNDPLAYLSRESDVLDQHLQALGEVPGPRYAYSIVPYSAHSWLSLDDAAVCDWLATQTLQLPSSGNTLADHDGAYFRLQVAQDAPGAFTPFAWSFDSNANQFTLSATKNLKSVGFDLQQVGLSSASALTVALATGDALPDQVSIANWPAMPTAMTRDGQPEISWSYDAPSQTLTLIEYDGAQHTWVITP